MGNINYLCLNNSSSHEFIEFGKIFSSGQRCHRCQVNWTQRNRCRFTNLLRIHTVIFISGAGGCFQYRSHYLDVGFGNFPNRKQASISASSELIVSPRFNKAITRDSQNTYISVHWHCNWRNISPCLMHNTMEFQYLPSMPRTSNYLIWT